MVKPLDPRLMRYASATKKYIIQLTLISVLSAVLVIVQIKAISAAISPVISDGQQLQDSLPMVWLLLAVVIVRAALRGLRVMLGHKAAARAVVQLREQILDHAAKLGPRWRARNGSDTATLVTRGLDDLDPYFVDYLPQLLLTAIVTPVMLIAILVLDFWSTLVALFTLPLIPIFMALIGRFTQNFTSKRLQTMEQLGTQLLELLTGLPTLRTLGRESSPRKHLAKISRKNTRTTLETLRVAFLSGGALEFLSTLSVALIAVEIGMRMVNGNVPLSVGLMVIMLAPEVFDPIRQVGTHFHASANGVAAAEAAFKILDLPIRPEGTAQPADEPVQIRFEDLSVAARGTWAPANLSATIEPGTITVLVGPSGAGKTTTTQVLLGFEQATKGQVWLGEVPVDQVDLQAWWRQVTWVPQFPLLYPGTVRDNLLPKQHGDQTPASGEGSREFSAEEIRRATELAGFDIDLDKEIGSEGVGLSVGQRQRLVLARALLERPRYLVLDEPTAHLDASLESQVVRVLQQLRADGCTVIVIAHREAVVKAADHVIEVASRPMTAAEEAEFSPTGTAPGADAGSNADKDADEVAFSAEAGRDAEADAPPANTAVAPAAASAVTSQDSDEAAGGAR